MTFRRRDDDTYADILDRPDPDWQPIRTGNDIGILLAGASGVLRSIDLPVAIDPAPYQLDLRLRAHALSFLDYRSRTVPMFNGSVVGLGSDLPHDVRPSGPQPVILRRTGYIDFVGTNLIAPYDVLGPDGGLVQRGRDLFLDEGRLRSFGGSPLANVIGVSTLAVCTDGRILIVNQSAANLGSPNRLAPSGSGSMEEVDLHPGDSLQQALVRGAERELSEESGVRPDEIRETAVIGHGRWLSRGAMPEFAAVTVVDMDSATICDRPIAGHEQVYVAGVTAIRLEPGHAWRPGVPQSMLPEPARSAASFPLLLALAAVAGYLETDGALAQDLTKLLANP